MFYSTGPWSDTSTARHIKPDAADFRQRVVTRDGTDVYDCRRVMRRRHRRFRSMIGVVRRRHSRRDGGEFFESIE